MSEQMHAERSERIDDNPEMLLPPDAVEAARLRIAELSKTAQEPNILGPWTLFYKEVYRFWRLAGQTLISPVVTTLLYFLVFGYSLGSRLQEIEGIPYIDFLVPGLVMLALINNAYINSAFSLFITKIQGTVVDILVTPLSPGNIMMGYVGASVVRAILVGTIIWIVAMLMGANTLHNPVVIVVFMLLTALFFSFIGLVMAVLARDFDNINLLPSFVIMPLTFLGGVFYSVKMLPDPWSTISLFNPVLYMVNGLRYGMTGISDVPLLHGLVMLSVLNVVFGALGYRLLYTGKNLRE